VERLFHVERRRTMADYRIVCVNHAPEGHIESVGYTHYDTEDRYDDIWTVEEARYAIRRTQRAGTGSRPS
jgi:hypothetical protein